MRLHFSLMTAWKYILLHKWIFLSLFFFITWKFFLLTVLWHDRELPPVPDDSLVYLLHIDATLNCENSITCHERAINLSTFAGYDHLTYRIFTGTLGKIFDLSPFMTYEISFYVGIILLAFALFYFLKTLYPGNQKLIAFSIFLFALYNGAGGFHGFYWVVPSFFAFVLFLLLASYILREDSPRFPWIPLFLISVLGVFIHLIFLYSLLIFFLYAFFYSIFTRKIQTSILKKILFSTAIAALFYFPVDHHYQAKSLQSPYSPSGIVSNLESSVSVDPFSFLAKVTDLEIATITVSLPGWKNIYENYFQWIFFHPGSYIFFAFCFLILFFQKQYKLLSLFISAFFFTLFSSVNIHGERSLLFLWPFTFLLYGHAAYFTFKSVSRWGLSQLLASVVKILVAGVFLFFTFLTLLYSYLWNTSLNASADWSVDERMLSSIRTVISTNQILSYSDKAYVIDLLFLLQNPATKPPHTVNIGEANYYLTLSKEKITIDTYRQSLIFQDFRSLLKNTLSLRGTEVPLLSYGEVPEKEGYTFVKVAIFGDFVLYRIEKNSPSQK